MIDKEDRLPLTRQCQLLNLNRSTVYYHKTPVSDGDLALIRRINEIHLAQSQGAGLAAFQFHGK